MNDPGWWITAIVSALAGISWWFFRDRLKRQDDRMDKQDARLVTIEQDVPALRTEMEKKVGEINDSIRSMKDSIIYTIQESERRLSGHMARLEKEMARDYLPRKEHREDMERLEDKIKAE